MSYIWWLDIFLCFNWVIWPCGARVSEVTRMVPITLNSFSWHSLGLHLNLMLFASLLFSAVTLSAWFFTQLSFPLCFCSTPHRCSGKKKGSLVPERHRSKYSLESAACDLHGLTWGCFSETWFPYSFCWIIEDYRYYVLSVYPEAAHRK